MRARRRPRGPVREPRQAARRIAGQPLMHRLPRHPKLAGTSVTGAPPSRTSSTARYRSTTPSSTSTPGPFRRDHPVDRSQAPRMRKTREPVRSVAHLPELLSASYRNRVRKVSPGNQNHGVKHLPGSHSAREQPRSNHGDKTGAQKITWGGKTPGQYGCAARDSNPEPAD